jgi:hypothetical protein
LETHKIGQRESDDEIDLEDRHERGGSVTSNSLPTFVMPKDMYCFCKVIFSILKFFFFSLVSYGFERTKHFEFG